MLQQFIKDVYYIALALFGEENFNALYAN